MAARPDTGPPPRVPLTRDRVLRTAVGIADEGGIALVTMRALAQALGVEAMSLYHHVASKNDLLDDMAEFVVAEINDRVEDDAGAPAPDPDWKAAVRRRILSARAVMLTHPWAPDLLASRTEMTPAVIRYFDGLMGHLLQGGLSPDLTHHALHALGSRALGFTQELFQPAEDAPGPDTAVMMRQLADQYPNIATVLTAATHDDASTLGWCDDQSEFEFGLDLVLEGLQHRAGAPPS